VKRFSEKSQTSASQLLIKFATAFICIDKSNKRSRVVCVYIYIYIYIYICQAVHFAQFQRMNRPPFRWPSVHGRISISLPCLFLFTAKESQEESRAVWIAKNGDMATPWINDRDNGLYGSAGLRIPSHKFRCAYNVKLIRRFLEASLGDFNGDGSREQKGGRCR